MGWIGEHNWTTREKTVQAIRDDYPQCDVHDTGTRVVWMRSTVTHPIDEFTGQLITGVLIESFTGSWMRKFVSEDMGPNEIHGVPRDWLPDNAAEDPDWGTYSAGWRSRVRALHLDVPTSKN